MIDILIELNYLLLRERMVRNTIRGTPSGVVINRLPHLEEDGEYHGEDRKDLLEDV